MVLIRVQTVCKGYQQMTEVTISKERVNETWQGPGLQISMPNNWNSFIFFISQPKHRCVVGTQKNRLICHLFDLILSVNIFLLCRDGSSLVEPVLSKDWCFLLNDTMQWLRWGSMSNLQPLGLESSTLSLHSLKEPSQWDVSFEHRKYMKIMFKLMAKK